MKTYRHQYDLSEQAHQEFTRLCKDAGFETSADLFKDALKLYRAYTDAKMAGEAVFKATIVRREGPINALER